MNEYQATQLQRIEIDGLFGIFDHRIELNHEDHVTVLHGPNGVGKTHTLGLINSLLTGNTRHFQRIPCKRLRLTFEDGFLELLVELDRAKGKLELSQGSKTNHEQIALSRSRSGRSSNPPSATLRERDWTPTWVTPNPPVLPEPSLPTWYEDFLKNSSVYFIETQRLVSFEQESTRRHWSPEEVKRAASGILPSTYPSTTSTVWDRNKDLRDLLRETMATYGRRAQALDQTFPQRLVAAKNSLADDRITERMAALTKEVEELEQLGILDDSSEQAHYLPGAHDENDDEQTRAMTAGVMALYVQDTEQKLEALRDFSKRLRSLLGSINSKFRNKKLRFDRAKGLVAETTSGRHLPLNSLSSGEQHELVMHYDLLFRTRPNAIVLIDEPELSLHVSWQKRFLPDLLEFAKLSAFDAIVATHSPYIIGERDDLMVALGDAV